jgi:hypothetical protein
MPAQQIPMQVELDGGRVLQVVADQRDIARWEAHDGPDGRYTRVRFLAWSAMTRQGLTTASWQQFNETDCVEVVDPPGADTEAPDDDERLDPGRPGRSAAT